MVAFTTTDAQTDWQWRYPTPAGYGLAAVAYGEGTVVAVGEGIVLSNNASEWEAIGASPTLTDVAYGGGEFVAVGHGGVAARSGDGRIWTYHRNELDVNFRAVEHGLGKWVAAGDDGRLYQSVDGLEFAEVALPGGALAGGFEGLGFSGTGFLATGIDRQVTPEDDLADKARVFFSSDGTNWNSFEGPDEWWRAGISNPVWQGGRWLVVINLNGGDSENWVSPNGAQWEKDSGPDTFSPSRIAYGPEVGITVGVSDTWSAFGYNSLPGTGWMEVAGPVRVADSPGSGVFTGYGYRDVVWCPDFSRWVAVGAAGGIAVAADVSQWNTVTPGFDGGQEPVRSVVRALGDFHATDGRMMFSSGDGVSWTRTGLIDEDLTLRGILKLEARQNEILALGYGGAIYSSPNGLVWQKESEWFDSENPPVVNFHSAAYGQGRWIVVGEEGFVGTSALDRSVWLARESNVDASLNEVVYTGTNFVACAQDGSLITSADGISWETTSAADNVPLATLAVSGSIANPMVIAAGFKILLSTDHGATWTEPATPGVGIEELIWAGDEFVGIGRYGEVWVSKDGVNWAQRASGQPFGSLAHQLAYDGETFVLAGNGLLSSGTRTTAPVHTLEVAIDGPGSVSVYPLLDAYEEGTPVTLTAEPFETFLGWSGDVTEFGILLELGMDRNYQITAEFFEPLDSPFDAILVGPFPSEISTRETAGWTVEDRPGPGGAVRPVAKSGYPAQSFELSYLEAFVFGAGTLEFDWRTDTQMFNGSLTLYVNGSVRASVTGSTDWAHQSIELDDGEFHEIQWAFRRSGSDGGLENAGFVTQVKWTPAGTGGPSFESWMALWDTGDGDISPAADLDGDGLSNFLEYALNLNPVQAGTAFLAPGEIDVDGQPWFGMHYRTWDGPVGRGVVYIAKRLGEDGTWTAEGVVDEPDPDAPIVAGSQARRARIPRTAGRGLLLLEVQGDPS